MNRSIVVILVLLVDVRLLGDICQPGLGSDCNRNGVVDSRESPDCNENSIPDECEVSVPVFAFERKAIERRTRESGLEVADLDGRNGADYIEWAYLEQELRILLNQGDGTFGPASTVALRGPPIFVHAGDLDRDRDLDLLVAWNPIGFEALINDGRGNFTPGNQLPKLHVLLPLDLKLADLNGDRAEDVLLVSRSSRFGQRGFVIYFNDGRGGFDFDRATLFDAERPFRVDHGDIDGDGDLDLALLTDQGSLQIYRNRGNGTFSKPEELRYRGVPLFADFDGDGRLDLLASKWIYWNNPQTGFADPIDMGFEFAVRAVGDFDGDGDIDLAGREGDFDPLGLGLDRDNLAIQWNNGNRRFGGLSRFDCVLFGSPHATQLRASDLDSDGITDLVFQESSKSSSVLLSRLTLNDRDADDDGIPDDCSDDAPRFVRGDCDGDGRACTGVNDAVVQLKWLFAGGERPSCVVACDANGNGNAEEIADPIYALNHCFLGGSPPPTPYPNCGRATPAECVNPAANCAP